MIFQKKKREKIGTRRDEFTFYLQLFKLILFLMDSKEFRSFCRMQGKMVKNKIASAFDIFSRHVLVFYFY